MPKITKLRLHLLKLFRENYWLLFFWTRWYNDDDDEYDGHGNSHSVHVTRDCVV